MFRPGSRFLFGLAAFGFVAAIVYSASTGGHPVGMETFLGPITFGYKGYVGDHVGYAILMGLALASLALGILLTALRDTDAESAAEAMGYDTVPEVPAPARASYWPVVGAFSLGAMTLGLAIGSAMFVVGLVGVSITFVEWAVRAWSDRATGDPEVNRTIRDRFMKPVEVPGLALLVIGTLVLAVSRILLALPKEAGYAVFILVPAAILGLGLLVASRPRLSQSAIAGMLLVGAVVLLGGGVIAAIAGEREHHDTHEETEPHDDEAGLAPLPASPQTNAAGG